LSRPSIAALTNAAPFTHLVIRPWSNSLSLSSHPKNVDEPCLISFSLPTPENIRAATFRNNIIGKGDIRIFGQTSSTMDDARAALPSCGDGAIFLADTQTKGRGTQGRTWFSPSGLNIYFTTIVMADHPLPNLPMAAGIAVAETIMEACDHRVRADLRWVNDVLVNGQKIAGILAESCPINGQTAHILGIGLNVNMTKGQMSVEIRPIATSLLEVMGTPFQRSSVLFQLLKSLDKWLERLKEGGFEVIRPRYVELCEWMVGRESILTRGSGDIQGRILGIEDSGHLVFRESTTGQTLQIPTGTLQII
jgi:BirA family biotin operon repressor/biotin-[acetyl-CoA-carboxylase] ligase